MNWLLGQLRLPARLRADCLLAGLAVAALRAEVVGTTPVMVALDVALVAALVALAGRRMRRPDSWATLAIPFAAGLLALGVMTYDRFDPVHESAFVLAALALLAGFARVALTFRDLRAVVASRREALTDDVTALPNRRGFHSRLARELVAAEASGGSVAVMMLDLNRFKELNETLGHEAGDELLQQVGPRLRAALRGTDTVARLGGDEFGIILPAPVTDGSASRVGAKLLRAIADEAFEVKGLSLHTSAGMGIALYPDHGVTGEDLMRRAEIAMYRAKEDRTQIELYVVDHDAHSRERLALIGELRSALENGELELAFQPKARTTDRGVHGVEALVRWHHPLRGSVPPAVFVPLAEQAGLSRWLTRTVLEMALAQARRWRDAGLEVEVSVNVTAADLLDSAFPDELSRVLEEHGVPPEAMVIEITETSVLADPDRIGDVLGRLGELGAGLSLDDFGTGYSSLTHLRTLPVGEVKIDRSFVLRMGSDVADAAIVRSTIELAHSLGMSVVAEGVEDDQTWGHLERLGCDLIQGYALSRPVPAEELDRLLSPAGG